ncbi:uncharacterized protein LOC108341315 [Vigna angularis]|uniref:uncharacterized protein LOC108341315 n=1 Tax=Phaseolus angularis TaxID=3914 RepID=UPI00080A3AD5|nr:uncharacterized protein LOC108341315 [Vigna angularis]
MQATLSNQKSTEAAIRNLEMQVGQIAKKLEEIPIKSFGANTEVNPKEECKVIVSVKEEREKKKEKAPPPKVKDPRSFTIPCIVRRHKIGKALIDLGSNINLVPLSVLEKIGGLEVKPARITLFMTDGSTKKLYGVVKDVMI